MAEIKKSANKVRGKLKGRIFRFFLVEILVFCFPGWVASSFAPTPEMIFASELISIFHWRMIEDPLLSKG